MLLIDWIQILLFIVLLVALIPPMGTYMAKVFQGEPTFLHPLLRPIERLSYWITHVDPCEEMGWKRYLKTLLIFNLLGFFALFLILEAQKILPFNPQHFGSPSWHLTFNTAASFVTNTDWQAYSGETTLSYFTQMCGLTVQNFLSAATGNAALLVLIRGIARKSTQCIGNFWVDLVRCVVYILLPLSMMFALVLVSQGVIQSLSPYIKLSTLENGMQTIPLGPAASQIAIKQLGTNGGGFFGTNSAHPFENPNAFTNFLEVLAIILIPAAATYMYGSMTNARKHGWLLLLAMSLIWVGGLALSLYSEYLNNPLLNAEPLLEGKESRIGVVHSILWSVTATATANGSVNAMLSSLSPLAGGVTLFNIMLGELIFGGVGVGLSSMLMFVFLTIFLAGLMVGRTPEYMGKKVEKREMQWVSLAILMPSALILVGGGISSVFPPALESLGNRGPHGLSEILYAFASCAGNNGSAFGGLNVNTPFYNCSLALWMIVVRLSIIIPTIAIAGTLAQKKSTPFSAGVFSTNTFLFLVLLIGVIVIVGALTFFPALSLGPIIEQCLMLKGESFE